MSLAETPFLEDLTAAFFMTALSSLSFASCSERTCPSSLSGRYSDPPPRRGPLSCSQRLEPSVPKSNETLILPAGLCGTTTSWKPLVSLWAACWNSLAGLGRVEDELLDSFVMKSTAYCTALSPAEKLLIASENLMLLMPKSLADR